jgi:hypothetical protein
VTPALDASHAVAMTVPTEGAALTTTTVDGTRYTLTIPPDAVLDPVEITMTPVTAVPDLPFSGGLVGGVQLAPDGLQLFSAATLTVELPSAPTQAGLTGFGWQGSGEAFHLELVAAEGSTLTFALTHFSGFGAGIAITGEIQAILAEQASNPETQAVNAIVGLIGQGVTDPQGYLNALRDWYLAAPTSIPTIAASGVRYGLSFLGFLGNDASLRRVLRGYIAWRQTIATVSTFINFDYALVLDPELRQAAKLAADALRVAIGRAHNACGQSQSQSDKLARANDAVRWQAVAEILGVVQSGIDIDLPHVLADLCLHAEITELIPPSLGVPIPGLLGPLKVRAGRMFTGAALTYGPNIRVTVAASGVTSPVPGGLTDANGYFDTTYTPSGGPLVLGISACVEEPAYPRLSVVCASRQLSSSSTTTLTSPTTTTTSTSLPGGGRVTPVLRNVLSSVQAGSEALDKQQNCCADFFTTPIDLPAGPLTDLPEFTPPGASGSATGEIDTHVSTVMTDGSGGITRITDDASGTVEFTSTNYVDVVAVAVAEFQYEFEVHQPVAWHITASVSATAPRGRRAFCNARVGLSGASFGIEIAAYDLTHEGGGYFPGGSSGVIQDSGTLAPGRYRLESAIHITGGTDDTRPSESHTVPASAQVTLTFGP